VRLTQAGKQFVQRGRKILSEISIAGQEVAAIGRSEDGQLAIGILSSLGSPYLGDLMQSYRQRHGAVRLTFIDGDQAEHVAAIRLLKLDVAFVTGNASWPGCETDELWSERVFAALPEQHVLASRNMLNWADLAAERFIVSNNVPGPEIHDYLVQRLSGLGQHPEIEEHSVGRLNLLSLVALGQGLTLASEGVTAIQVPGVVFRPVVDETLPYSMIWSAQNDNPALRSLLVLAREMARTGYAGQSSFMFGAPDQTGEPWQNPDPLR
jgi:DNA-binding transcriptional LysR family regulator